MHFDAGRETGEGEKAGPMRPARLNLTATEENTWLGSSGVKLNFTNSDSLKQPFIGRLPGPS